MKIVADVQGDYTGLFTFDPLVERAQDFEVQSGQHASIVHTHLEWQWDGELVDFQMMHPVIGLPVADLASELAANNSVLAISWDPMSINFELGKVPSGETAEIGLQSILDGHYDAYIRHVAQQVASMETPIMMNLLGEADSNALLGFGPNGDQYIGDVEDRRSTYGDHSQLDGPERVQDLFRYVIDIFNEEGADNVTWFMYMSSENMQSEASFHPKLLYPGDDYIDWVGQSLYIEKTDELSETFDPGYDAWGEITGKPFFIPEMGFEIGGDPQISELIGELQNYDRVNAYVWSDYDGLTEDWNVFRLGDDSRDWEAFQSDSVFAESVNVNDGSSIQEIADWYVGGGHDVILGDSGNNLLVGTEEADKLAGEGGDDVYVVDDAGDDVREDYGNGVDIVVSKVDYSLPENVEHGILEANAMELSGNDLENMLIGNSENNILRGMNGDDILIGEGGADQMIGGAGNDVYIVDSILDEVFEMAGEGDDLIIARSSFKIDGEIETLVMEGPGDFEAIGNDSANILIGNNGDNNLHGMDGDDVLEGDGGDDELSGGDGNDILIGGVGNDVLSGDAGDDIQIGGAGDDILIFGDGSDYAEGGEGADRFVYNGSDELSVIGDFSASDDVLDLSGLGFADRAELNAATYDADGSVLILQDEMQLYLSDLSYEEFEDSLILL